MFENSRSTSLVTLHHCATENPHNPYREAAEGEDLSIHEEHSCVVTASSYLDTGAWEGLHQSGRAPTSTKTAIQPWFG